MQSESTSAQGYIWTSLGMERFCLDRFPLDLEAIPASALNIERKDRSNHFPWSGQFSPQFIEAILSHYSSQGQLIYDPFCGSGTVLGEAGRLGLHAVGSDVNPAAFHLARVYTLMSASRSLRHEIIKNLEGKLSRISGWGGMFGQDAEIHDFPAALLELVEQSREEQRVIAEALVILSDVYKGATYERVSNSWKRLKHVLESLPVSETRIDVQLRDCRDEVAFAAPVDLVLTSPPYINVYNYHQQYRASAEMLGWNLLAVAPSEIGSNRKHRGNRFLTVVQYCVDMAESLRVMGNCIAKHGRIILVLGRESRVCRAPFYNGEIIARLGVEALGYSLVLRQERVFTNRFGQKIVEDILHFRPGDKHVENDFAESRARHIAIDSLEAASQSITEEETRKAIDLAIDSAMRLQPSPRFGEIVRYKSAKGHELPNASS